MAFDYVSDPFVRGRENFLADYHIDDNPYPQNTEQHELWNAGFTKESNDSEL
ncbi:hypothetical protein [Paraglaciecola chathamensis]|uniref:Uncharacterized protein n=1 Tax=Paraglaciecola chathamensis TaxID=368405 RepID=A0A8H9IE54_9ALTE|nr:hypothetical protein [Paraglaciecola oceanifecundans]GGZ83260.1 hypothetical protein GCM10011274_46120 [Paraglaciecola oceanifecundans]